MNSTAYRGFSFLRYGQSRQLCSDFIIVFPHSTDVDAELPCDVAFVAHTGILNQIGGKLLFLGTDAVGILGSLARPQSGDLRFHLDDQAGQLCFGFLTGATIYISGMFFTIRPDGRISPFPDVVIDLLDVACSWSAAR